MAQVPLITNIKCAKLFIDAIQTYPDIHGVPLATYDTIASSRLVDLPGLVEVAARTHVDTSEGVAMTTADGLQAGFTLVNIIASENGMWPAVICVCMAGGSPLHLHKKPNLGHIAIAAYLATLRERSGLEDRPHCDFALSSVANVSADAAGAASNNGQGVRYGTGTDIGLF